MGAPDRSNSFEWFFDMRKANKSKRNQRKSESPKWPATGTGSFRSLRVHRYEKQNKKQRQAGSFRAIRNVVRGWKKRWPETPLPTQPWGNHQMTIDGWTGWSGLAVAWNAGEFDDDRCYSTLPDFIVFGCVPIGSEGNDESNTNTQKYYNRSWKRGNHKAQNNMRSEKKTPKPASVEPRSKRHRNENCEMVEIVSAEQPKTELVKSRKSTKN